MKTETVKVTMWALGMTAALLGSTLRPSAALADEHRGIAESRILRYADLDLTRRADVLELYRRIDDTARRVCTGLGTVVPDDACLSDAIARTVDKIGLPALTSIYAAKTHQPEKRVMEAKQPTECSNPVRLEVQR
jgi:UrcA family protein